ncbi:ankyrin repeat and MYND domain-containing protein 2 [Nasonia vitripennis]|uniref:MYND-type domain-containing protein n=1 Tax=Nasonia vitripennis TaxID=7425 RepID=A0A7M7G8F1_NASVI|nr:ankyrin repeat and MYND domain-containing protein 2 [Nasonia vitripennis]XP_008206468.1 ankyrin repeat and MYND domain-containing protein 2 [Nasonia vitripennis]XP_008206469.1 ankyrin repeat and MYND domain-containing protein 2 [Nasonia vitripennis]XP_008206470.1 ankyrin repeat and MYND domain-containing protein 2 [Nasonia vitripennis]
MSNAESLPNLQKEIFEKISNNKTDELKALLAAHKIKIDFIDENGMSPLQHACYKGNKEIVQMLLDHGADPNQCKHEHQYTALHFAALSGNADLCQLLMSYGAKMSATNSVGRTAAQMAAFVGNHNCVATINNFIPKADIDYYIKPQGLQTEPMLQPHLADSFHSFITQVNVHPVRVIMNLQKFPGLLDNLPMIQKVLEAMRQREMTRAEANEVMAFKYHYLSCVVAEVIKCQKRQEAMKADKIDKEKGPDEKVEEKSDEKRSDVIELLAKKFLKCKSDGTLEYQELFLRETVREFHYRESAIFRQMVATLASSDPPSAISVIAAAINGQRAFTDNAQDCVTCGEEKATKKCSKCKQVQYCDRECQRLHWFIHKKTCSRLIQLNTSNAKVPDPNSEQISNAVTSRLKNLDIN